VQLQILVSRWVRYMSTKSHICKKCGILRMKIFSIMGYAQIHKQRPFFWQSKRHLKNYCIKNSNSEHMHWCLFYTHTLCFLKNIKISNFGGISKFLKLIVWHGQILANFDDFGLIWASSATLPMDDNMAQYELKT
jgi:hypothetical protein